MSGRAYLSIGDVLSLLREEFPDVTISKIRFLESQGLVNPERTPSGYRKFFEPDVERLRWVLRQQREHFLPLKVIKGRLDNDLQPPPDQPVLPLVPGHEVGARGPLASQPGTGDDHARFAQRTASAVAVADAVAEVERGGVRGGQLGAQAPFASRSGASRRDVEDPTPRSSEGSAGSSVTTRIVETSGGQAPPQGAYRGATAADEAVSGTLASAPGYATGPSRPSPPRSSPRTQPVDATPRPSAPALAVGTLGPGATMTLEELAAAAGLSLEEARELESYGLISGKTVGGVVYYDAEALTISAIAAGFASFGVEARHLRLHKHAAEREAGFIEAVVLPLLKQRNPQSRQKAQEMVVELSRLGMAMRAALLHSALRDQIGG